MSARGQAMEAARARFWLTYKTTWSLTRALDDALEVCAERMAREKVLPPGPVTHDVLQRVCLATGTAPDQILERRQDRAVSRSRAIVMWVLRELGLSFVETGEAIGRDHSTVMYACRLVYEDPDLLAVADRILSEVRTSWRNGGAV